LLSYTGIHPDRLLLEWVSASEANRFAEVVEAFTQQVKALGPLETKRADTEAVQGPQDATMAEKVA